MGKEQPVVLVVEDERDLADLYAAWLSGDYEVRTAYDGESALEQIDEAVAAVLLDRRMPDLSGDAVLEEIRARGLDCRVAMVTAVEPDFDIIDMGFDTYIVKPVTSDELQDTVETLLERQAYDDRTREYYSLSAKKAVLEGEKTEAELTTSPEYTALETRIEELREELDEAVAGFDEEDFAAAFRDLDTDTEVDDIGEDRQDGV